MPANEWATAEHALRYLERADEVPHRATAEATLLAQLPERVERVVDLGTGDGRLLALVRAARPGAEGIGLDGSDVMLERARERFAGEDGVQLEFADLAEPLESLGLETGFDAVVSSFAIHHLEHERKESLYREAFDLLRPGGVFANLEHVASPSQRVHEAFFAAIDEPLEHEDPSDKTLDVQTQLEWLRGIGFADVDCYFKWLEVALMVGVKPPAD